MYRTTYGNVDEDRTDPAEFAPPRGLFVVGYADSVPVACGGWRRLAPDIAEIKRMYVVEGARRTGLARRVLAELERTAARDGITRMTLNTGYLQTDAIAFYEANGYERTADRFGHYAAFEGAYFFAKTLRTTNSPPRTERDGPT